MLSGSGRRGRISPESNDRNLNNTLTNIPIITNDIQFKESFGPLQTFFKCYGIQLFDDSKNCLRFLIYPIVIAACCMFYVDQISTAMDEQKKTHSKSALAFVIETFFMASRLYLTLMTYLALIVRQKKLLEICKRLIDMTFITIGHKSPIYKAIRKQNIIIICLIHFVSIGFVCYYYILPIFAHCTRNPTSDVNYSNNDTNSNSSDSDPEQTCLMACVKCSAVVIGHFIVVPIQFVVILLFLQICRVLNSSFVNLTQKRGLDKFPPNLCHYKANRYIEYHIIHSKLVTFLNDIFRELVITWSGLECLLVIYAIRQMDLHKAEPSITWNNVISIVFHVLLFGIKAIIPANVNDQVSESLKGLTVMSTVKKSKKSQTVVTAYEPITYQQKNTMHVDTKIKLYIENVLMDKAVITGMGMYNISKDLVLEAFSQVLTYVIILYGIPT